MHGFCPICGDFKKMTDHHKLKQSKLYKKLYSEFIHDPKNLQKLCLDCHLSKKEGIIIWNEQEFCDAFGIKKPRSKEGLGIWKRQQNK